MCRYKWNWICVRYGDLEFLFLGIETISMTFEWKFQMKRYGRLYTRFDLFTPSVYFDFMNFLLADGLGKEWFPWNSLDCHRQYLDFFHNKWASLTESVQTIRIESDSEKFVPTSIPSTTNLTQNICISKWNQRAKLVEHTTDHWAIERSLYQFSRYVVGIILEFSTKMIVRVCVTMWLRVHSE